MKICLIGQNLTNLILALAIAERKFPVEIYLNKKTKKYQTNRTIAISSENFKFIKLPVSSPFHCPLMSKATHEMKDKINNTEFKNPNVTIISNVTANPTNSSTEIKKLLIDQIEKPVRWRESVNNMIKSKVNHFIEVGPGKVLSGLVKRIDRNVKLNQVNKLEDLKVLTND